MGSERIPMVVTGPGPESAEEEDDLFGHHHLEVVGILRTAVLASGRALVLLSGRSPSGAGPASALDD
jgi:hypothetical protein